MQILINKAHVVIALWGKSKLYPFNFTHQLHIWHGICETCRCEISIPCEALSKHLSLSIVIAFGIFQVKRHKV